MTKHTKYGNVSGPTESWVRCDCGWNRMAFTQNLGNKLLKLHQKKCNLPKSDNLITFEASSAYKNMTSQVGSQIDIH
jgi:hypothetical protein